MLSAVSRPFSWTSDGPDLNDETYEEVSAQQAQEASGGRCPLRRPHMEADTEMVLDQALRSFIQSMQYGIEVEVVLDDGQLLGVELSLDARATRLLLRVREVERDIPLDDIVRICSPEQVPTSTVSNREHLHEGCSTLMLSSTQFLTFSFDTPRLREYFEACMQALVASHQACSLGDCPNSSL